jgi:hypothetical protein
MGDVTVCRQGGDRDERRHCLRMTAFMSAWRNFEDNTMVRR